MSLKSLAVAGTLALSLLVAPATALAVENGPAPTVSSIRVDGSFPIDRYSIPDSRTPGFGAAVVYAPKDASKTYGAIAIAPGWTETMSAIHWFGPRLASHGFVTIVFNVNNTFSDFPTHRAAQLLRAVDFLSTPANPAAARVDASRTAVAGHSMGGGGALEASLERPSLKAVVGLEPWHGLTDYSSSVVPSLIIGAQFDIIAPVNNHALPFYRSIPATTPKAYFEIRNGDHFATNKPNRTASAETVAWIKRFVDGDTRYSQFIWPAAIGADAGVQNRYLVNGPF